MDKSEKLQRRAASVMWTVNSDEALGHLAYQSFASRHEEHVAKPS